MSDPSREQAQRFLDGYWNTILTAVSESRKISKAELNRHADEMMTFESADALVKAKFFDGQMYNDEIRNAIKEKLGIDKDDDIPQASVADLCADTGDDAGDELW